MRAVQLSKRKRIHTEWQKLTVHSHTLLEASIPKVLFSSINIITKKGAIQLLFNFTLRFFILLYIAYLARMNHQLLLLQGSQINLLDLGLLGLS